MIDFDFNIQLDTNQIVKKVNGRLEQAQIALDQQVLKDSNYFVPKREGYLEKSGILHTVPGSGEVKWEMPYARRLFYGIGYNFSKDPNPNASALWYYAAESRHKQDWIRIAQQTYDKG